MMVLTICYNYTTFQQTNGRAQEWYTLDRLWNDTGTNRKVVSDGYAFQVDI